MGRTDWSQFDMIADECEIFDNKPILRSTIKFSHWDRFIFFMFSSTFISVLTRGAVASEVMQNLNRHHPAFAANRTYGDIDA